MSIITKSIETRMECLPLPEGRGKWGSTGFLLGVMKMYWNLIVMTVARFYECTKTNH